LGDHHNVGLLLLQPTWQRLLLWHVPRRHQPWLLHDWTAQAPRRRLSRHQDGARRQVQLRGPLLHRRPWSQRRPWLLKLLLQLVLKRRRWPVLLLLPLVWRRPLGHHHSTDRAWPHALLPCSHDDGGPWRPLLLLLPTLHRHEDCARRQRLLLLLLLPVHGPGQACRRGWRAPETLRLWRPPKTPSRLAVDGT
jgi:hypothetical protein